MHRMHLWRVRGRCTLHCRQVPYAIDARWKSPAQIQETIDAIISCTNKWKPFYNDKWRTTKICARFITNDTCSGAGKHTDKLHAAGLGRVQILMHWQLLVVPIWNIQHTWMRTCLSTAKHRSLFFINWWNHYLYYTLSPHVHEHTFIRTHTPRNENEPCE